MTSKCRCQEKLRIEHGKGSGSPCVIWFDGVRYSSYQAAARSGRFGKLTGESLRRRLNHCERLGTCVFLTTKQLLVAAAEKSAQRRGHNWGQKKDYAPDPMALLAQQFNTLPRFV